MNIEQKIIPGLLKRPLSEARHIIVHDTGNPNSKIAGEVGWMTDNYAASGIYVTHFIDAEKVVQIAPSGYISNGAGYVNPYAYAQIEMVNVPASDFPKQVELLGQLLKKLCAESGVPARFTSDKTKGIMTHKSAAVYYGGSNHSDPDSYVMSRGWSMDQFQKRLVEIINGAESTGANAQPIEFKNLTLTVPFNAKGACWITNPEGAKLYQDTVLTKPVDRVVPYGSAWQIYGAGDGGIFTIGNNLYISQADAVAKFSKGMGMGDYTGMTAIIKTDDCFTQKVPEFGQPGIEKLPQGFPYRIFNQSEDFKFVDLGMNQWVDTKKLNIVL